MNGCFEHVPVLFDECMDGLKIKKDGIYVDCTAGGGGHSSGIVSRLGAEGKLISLDKDDEALATCEARRKEIKDGVRPSCYHLEQSLKLWNMSLLTRR